MAQLSTLGRWPLWAPQPALVHGNGHTSCKTTCFSVWSPGKKGWLPIAGQIPTPARKCLGQAGWKGPSIRLPSCHLTELLEPTPGGDGCLQLQLEMPVHRGPASPSCLPLQPSSPSLWCFLSAWQARHVPQVQGEVRDLLQHSQQPEAPAGCGKTGHSHLIPPASRMSDITMLLSPQGSLLLSQPCLILPVHWLWQGRGKEQATVNCWDRRVHLCLDSDHTKGALTPAQESGP